MKGKGFRAQSRASVVALIALAVSASAVTLVPVAGASRQLVGSASALAGADWSQQAVLTAPGSSGTVVALSGDTALVGAPSPLYKGTGTAYVFVRRGSTWTQQATLIAKDGAGGAAFGASVALSGDTALVGASSRNNFTGAAYLYVRRGSIWTQQATLTAKDGAAQDQFGTSVALNGNTALVGAHGKNNLTGAAYIFVRRGNTWSQQAELTASDGVSNDDFGASVALSGSTALVGATGKSYGVAYQGAGAAYVFARKGRIWTQQAELTDPQPRASNDQFGASAALSGNTAVIGAPHQNNNGEANVYVRYRDTWTPQATLTVKDGTPYDRAGDGFGTAVSLSRNTIVAAAPLRWAAYVFARRGRTWRRQALLAAAGPSVALDGSTALVGSTGAVHVFGRQAGAAGQAPSVANPGLVADLSTSAQGALAHNGFVVIAPPQLSQQTALSPQSTVYWQFYDLYDTNVGGGIPAFVTSDALLHTFHVIYDQTLIVFERSVLAGKLQRLSQGLGDASAAQYAAVTDPRLKAAARLNLAYVAVAERLLNPRAATPAVVATDVNREFSLIAAHQGFALSPVIGYTIDYSRFVPRGHYTGDTILSRYFQAMTWYGLLTFHLNGADGPQRTRQALLLVRALVQRPDLQALWASIFDPISAWVGRSDDLTARDYQAVMARVYGAHAPLNALADDARLARFIALANALPDPQIRDELLTSSTGAATVTKGLRLFGQRFTVDAAIMQALIWDKVGTPQQPRVWPTGLDVAAALGSTRASDLVTGHYNQTRYAHYAQQLATVQRTYRTLPRADWSQNLYWRWLNALRAVWGPVPPAAPAFMKTTAWAAKSVATGLASWAELRHDTLLYAKQYCGCGAGGPPLLPIAYVEPIPLVYARLLELTQGLEEILIKEGVLDRLPQPIHPYHSSSMGNGGPTGYRAALDDFASLVALAQRVAEQELLGQKVATADLLALEGIGGTLNGLTDFFQDNAALGWEGLYHKQVAGIADVFTEPRSRQVLEVGVGDVLPIYVMITVNGQRWLARGGVYSYYEFHQPMSERLSDDAWRRMSRRPELPAWTDGYVVN